MISTDVLFDMVDNIAASFDAVGWAAGRASACKKLLGCWHGYSVWGEVQICIWPS